MRVKAAVTTVVAIVVLLTASCSSGSKTSSTTSTTRRNLAQDHDLAKRSLVTERDLPAGWVAAASAESGPMAVMDEANLRPLADCLKVPTTKLAPSAAATETSPVLQAPDGSTVQSRVSVLASPAQATAAVEALGTTAFATCVKQRLEAGIKQPLAHPVLPPDVSVSSINAAPVKWPKYGDSSRAQRVRTSLIGDQQGLDLYLQLVFIARGRSLATLAFTSSREPFALDQAENLSLVLSNRVPA